MIDDPGAEAENSDLESEVAVQHQIVPMPIWLFTGSLIAAPSCSEMKFPAIPAGRKTCPISDPSPSPCPTLAQIPERKLRPKARG